MKLDEIINSGVRMALLLTCTAGQTIIPFAAAGGFAHLKDHENYRYDIYLENGSRWGFYEFEDRSKVCKYPDFDKSIKIPSMYCFFDNDKDNISDEYGPRRIRISTALRKEYLERLSEEIFEQVNYLQRS